MNRYHATALTIPGKWSNITTNYDRTSGKDVEFEYQHDSLHQRTGFDSKGASQARTHNRIFKKRKGRLKVNGVLMTKRAGSANRCTRALNSHIIFAETPTLYRTFALQLLRRDASQSAVYAQVQSRHFDNQLFGESRKQNRTRSYLQHPELSDH